MGLKIYKDCLSRSELNINTDQRGGFKIDLKILGRVGGVFMFFELRRKKETEDLIAGKTDK